MSKDIFHQKLDTLLAQDVGVLVSVQRKKMSSFLEQTGVSFVLFGAGRLGRIALDGLRKAGVEPLAFADNSSHLQGQKVDGLEVLSPQEAKLKFGQKALFVITIYTNTPLRLQLQELNVRFVTFAELAWYYSQTLLPHYATDLPDAIFNQAIDVRQALDIWADDASRNEYVAQLSWRTSLDPNVLPSCSRPQDMYFKTDLFSILSSDVLVDCGAFDGDTIRELEKQSIEYQRLIAIEPDPINYRKLGDCISALPDKLRGKILSYQNAVGSIREQLNFDATGTASTTMTSGSYTVESVPLDLLLAAEQPTYIKMDIEGAEYEALRGARQTIQSRRPILAICLYHRQDDLWRIPLLIRSMSDRYRLFLRRYSDECWEEVCYAVPEERILS